MHLSQHASGCRRWLRQPCGQATTTPDRCHGVDDEENCGNARSAATPTRLPTTCSQLTPRAQLDHRRRPENEDEDERPRRNDQRMGKPLTAARRVTLFVPEVPSVRRFPRVEACGVSFNPYPQGHATLWMQRYSSDR